MTAKGKINASNVQVNDRILITDSTSWQTGEPILVPSQTKTGEDVRTVRVIGKTFRAAQGRYERQGKYVVETTAGNFEAAPIQTMWLAPEDAAGVKRAHVEALAEDADYELTRASTVTSDHVEALAEDVRRDARSEIGRCWAGAKATGEALAAYGCGDYAEALRIARSQQAAQEVQIAEDEPVDWAGRKLGELTPDEQRRVARQAGKQLQAEFDAAGPALAEAILADDATAVVDTGTGRRWPTPDGPVSALDHFTKVRDGGYAGPDNILLYRVAGTWEIMRDRATEDDPDRWAEELGGGSPNLERAAELALAHYTVAAVDRAHGEALDEQAARAVAATITRLRQFEPFAARVRDVREAAHRKTGKPLGIIEGKQQVIDEDHGAALAGYEARRNRELAVGDTVTIGGGSMPWKVLEVVRPGGQVRADLIRGSLLGPQWFGVDVQIEPVSTVDLEAATPPVDPDVADRRELDAHDTAVGPPTGGVYGAWYGEDGQPEGSRP